MMSIDICTSDIISSKTAATLLRTILICFSYLKSYFFNAVQHFSKIDIYAKLLRKVSIPHPEMPKRDDVFQIAEKFPHFLEILRKNQKTKAGKHTNSNENSYSLSQNFSINYPK